MKKLAARMRQTWDGSLMGRDLDSPVDEGRRECKCIGSRVEDAEPCTIICAAVLTWGRQGSLDHLSVSLVLATMMRIVEMHEGPSLRIGLAPTKDTDDGHLRMQ